MKKNLLSVLILALLIMNVILTAVMMFSITSTNKKTAAIVDDIAGIIKIELEGGTTATTDTVVSMADTEVYDLDTMTVSLKQSPDGTDHYVSLSISISMNMKDADYATYGGEAIATKASIIKGIINDAFSQYTMEDIKAQSNYDTVRADILARIQAKFASKFIYDVIFSDTIVQ